jgi:phospholipid/cholesterol/gamma-HCH transport system ATP-binding protein
MEQIKSEFVIQIEHLKKSFGENNVLVDINLNIKKGENVVVLGKSGSGKSVLIKCIVGLINTDEGELKVFDEEINNLDNKALNTIRKK